MTSVSPERVRKMLAGEPVPEIDTQKVLERLAQEMRSEETGKVRDTDPGVK